MSGRRNQRKKYYEINKNLMLFKESNKHMTDIEQPKLNVARLHLTVNAAYNLSENKEITSTNADLNFSLSSGDEINDTNEDLTASVNSETEIIYNNDQIEVNKEIDRDISCECKYDFENNSDIGEPINEGLFVLLYKTHNIIPPTSKVSD